MKYDREVIKQFIKDYHKESKYIDDVDDDALSIDDFFELNEDVANMELNENTDSQIFFNELDQFIYAVGTRREYYIFFLLCEGKSFEDIGKVMQLTGTRIRQLFDGLLDKLE